MVGLDELRRLGRQARGDPKHGGAAVARRRDGLCHGHRKLRRLVEHLVLYHDQVGRAEKSAYAGGPEQGPYLNLVVELDTPLDARRLLDECRRLEDAAGRVRAERWGPRTLDVDVLWVEGEHVNEPDLQVPHPRMWARRFVLAPLADLAPDLVGPNRVAEAEGEVRRLGPLEDLPA